jgi:endonuclease/exonuclease/phosphatase family metal-dependent hydrolase
MTFAFTPAADNTLGNLILSKAALHNIDGVSLPRSGRQARRSALVATVDVAGHPVTLMDVHVQHGHGEDPTKARLRQLSTALASWEGRPRTVLIGDLNAGPGSPEVNEILSAGFITSADTGNCSKPTGHGECLDWTFVTPDLTQGQIQVPAIGPSDHRPTLSIINVND